MKRYINSRRRTINKLLVACLVVVVVSEGRAAPAGGDSLRFEVLLTGAMLDSIKPDGPFNDDVDVTPGRLLLLSTADQFYALGWGGIAPLGKKVAGVIGAYAYTPDKLLMVIRDDGLCAFDSLGNLSRLFKLPDRGMGISAGSSVMYVYGRDKNRAKNALYVIAKGGKYEELFEVPAPITAAVETGNTLLFATGNGLFRFNPGNKELKAIAALPGNNAIKSIAVDTSARRIFFSTDSGVYAVKDSSIVIITAGFGGILRYFDGGLIVFDPEKKSVIRMVGIEKRIAPVNGDQPSPAAGTPLPAILSGAAAFGSGGMTWNQLYASSWLSKKSGEAAGEGDLDEASFLSEQAFKAANGDRLSVAVPKAPPPPASFGLPANVQVFCGFVSAIYAQAKKVLEATVEVKDASGKRAEAGKRAEEGQNPPNGPVDAASQAFENAKQEEAQAQQRQEREEKILRGLCSLFEKAESGSIDITRFSQVKQ